MPKLLSADTILAGPFRLAYMHVFEPRKNEQRNGVEEYSVRLLLPKKATPQCPNPGVEWNEIKALVDQIAAAKFGANFKAWDSLLKSGDKELSKSTGEPQHPGYMYLNLRTSPEYPPVLIDCDKHNVTKGSGWKSGDWGMVRMRLWAYDSAGNKGVSGSLMAIQFTHIDEALGSSVDAATMVNDFDVVKGDKPKPTLANTSANGKPNGAIDDGGLDEGDPFED
jgi:hypothetical protein